MDRSQQIHHYSEVGKLFSKTNLDVGTAVDYIIVRRDAFPWHKVPDLVIGRPVYDSWMVG